MNPADLRKRLARAESVLRQIERCDKGWGHGITDEPWPAQLAREYFAWRDGKCPQCGGTGTVTLPPAYPRFHTFHVACGKCGGTGQLTSRSGKR